MSDVENQRLRAQLEQYRQAWAALAERERRARETLLRLDAASKKDREASQRGRAVEAAVYDMTARLLASQERILGILERNRRERAPADADRTDSVARAQTLLEVELGRLEEALDATACELDRAARRRWPGPEASRPRSPLPAEPYPARSTEAGRSPHPESTPANPPKRLIDLERQSLDDLDAELLNLG